MVAGMVKPDKELQLRNILIFRFVSPDPIVTVTRLPHPKNKEWPTDVTLFGISMLTRLLHPLNTRLPICVTLLGIVILVMPEQF